MNKILLSIVAALSSLLIYAGSPQKTGTNSLHPKREFRGAWIQCVNGQYLGKSIQQIREMLSSQLDVLEDAGINVILFQCRAEGDALYKSSIEPWSRYLTGRQGTPPPDGWDPLAWMVEECHKRNMELHAWINPYRGKTKGTTELATNHYCIRYPQRYFYYGDLMIINPALRENRDYTCRVIKDIVERYDVDGLHIDDYFYPYPDGTPLPDAKYFEADRRGFSNIADWRRDNVTLLIKDIQTTIRETKPWVKFGVSPFGIYRNSPSGKNCAEGSATNGKENYDDLYADIVLWDKEGYIDYLIPQIYWNIGTKVADYEVLCNWWNDYCSNRPLIVGQDVERTVKGSDPKNPKSHQMKAKYALQRSLPNIKGSCQWYAAAVVSNTGNYCTMLKNVYHKYPALQPLMPFIDNKAPGKVKKLHVKKVSGMRIVSWQAPKAKHEMDRAVQYVVYKFDKKEKVDLDNAEKIIKITRDNSISLTETESKNCVIVVTALDRLHNESKHCVKKIK